MSNSGCCIILQCRFCLCVKSPDAFPLPIHTDVSLPFASGFVVRNTFEPRRLFSSLRPLVANILALHTCPQILPSIVNAICIDVVNDLTISGLNNLLVHIEKSARFVFPPYCPLLAIGQHECAPTPSANEIGVLRAYERDIAPSEIDEGMTAAVADGHRPFDFVLIYHASYM